MNLTDRELLARTIMAEAGNQGPVGMMGVGSVIMNRLQSSAYGNTLPSVILQPGQFSAWNSRKNPDGSFVYAGGQQGQNMSKIQPSEQAYMVADQILDGNYNDPTGGATHYYNPRISNPNWGQRAGGNWQQIGAHLFGVPGKKDPTRISTMNANNAPLNAIPSMGPVTQKNAQLMQPAAKPKQRGLFDFLGKAVGGSFAGLKGALDGSDPDKSDKLAIALMSLSGNPQQLQPLMQMAANDIQERAKKKSANKTVELIKSIDPKLGAMAEANPAMAGNIMSAIASKQLDNKGGQIMTAAQIKAMYPGVTGIEDGLYNVKTKDGELVSITKSGGGGTTNEINMPGSAGAEEELLKKLMGKKGERYAKFLDAGANSAGLSIDIETLAALAPLQPSGPLVGRLADMFPEFTDIGALRQSIVKRIAPQMRVEGSGSTSDTEFNAMLNSFGSLRNSPEANQAILSIFQQKIAFDIARRDIVNEYTNRNITMKEADEKMAALETQSMIPTAVSNLLQTHKVGEGETPSGPKRLRWDPETRTFK
jgi:hypothetical protein